MEAQDARPSCKYLLLSTHYIENATLSTTDWWEIKMTRGYRVLDGEAQIQGTAQPYILKASSTQLACTGLTFFA